MAKSKSKNDLIQNITNRYRVTAREARDIVTAAGSVYMSGYGKTVGASKSAVKDVAKQVAETGRAAVTGKKGTTAGKVNRYKSGNTRYTEYTPGTSRDSAKRRKIRNK